MIVNSTQHAATPPPLYLTSGADVIPYCHTCGRVISEYYGSSLEVYHRVCAPFILVSLQLSSLFEHVQFNVKQDQSS